MEQTKKQQKPAKPWVSTQARLKKSASEALAKIEAGSDRDEVISSLRKRGGAEAVLAFANMEWRRNKALLAA